MEQSRKRPPVRSSQESAVTVVRAVPDVAPKERKPPVTIRKISRSVDSLSVRVKALERSMGELSATLERHLDELHRTLGVVSRRMTQLAAQRPPEPPVEGADGSSTVPPRPRRRPSPERVEELRRKVWGDPGGS